MTNGGFPNPFGKNHCVVIAFTHAAQGDKEMALRLAEKARAGKVLDKHGAAQDLVGNRDWWAEQVNLKVVKTIHYRRPKELYVGLSHWRHVVWKTVPHLRSLERWVRNHRKGIYVVRVRGHAVAVVNGVVYGYYRPKSRILTTIKLERAG